MKIKLLLLLTVCTLLLTGCYSISLENPIRKNKALFTEMLGKWKVINKDTKTVNTNDTVPIIPLLHTYTS